MDLKMANIKKTDENVKIEKKKIEKKFKIAENITEKVADENEKQRAFKIFKELAEKHKHIKSTNLTGWCYDTGYGVEENKEKALEFYKQAALYGYPFACFNIGYHHEIKNEFLLAFKYYQRAHELNTDNEIPCRDLFRLVFLYYFGLGTTVNYKSAFDICHDLAERSYTPAKLMLTYMFDEGVGAKINKEAKDNWLKRINDDTCTDHILSSQLLLQNLIFKFYNAKIRMMQEEINSKSSSGSICIELTNCAPFNDKKTEDSTK